MLGHWFVIASQKTVNIFTEATDKKKLMLVKKFSNPIFIEKENDVYVSTDEALHHFAKEVNQYLELQRQQKNYQALTVVAEPHFLGILKHAMKHTTQKMVLDWVKKDLLKTPSDQLEQMLIDA